jgi:hypothetical protein
MSAYRGRPEVVGAWPKRRPKTALLTNKRLMRRINQPIYSNYLVDAGKQRGSSCVGCRNSKLKKKNRARAEMFHNHAMEGFRPSA